MIEAKIETEVVLRDFVYLDWKRVRSLCAQLFAGVPQDSTKEKGHNVGTKGQLEGGIPAVLKGHGEADYRYFRTENETRSLHHYVYSLFEERLVDRGMVTEVEDDFDITQWNEDFFHDGRFIRVVGLVRLMDYAWVSTMMETLPEMMRAAQHAENISLKERLAAQEISKREYEAQQKEQQKQLHELKSLKLDKMTGLVRQLYGDVVCVKVVPDKYRPSNVFVGSGDLAHFHDSAASLSQKYGYEIDADWVTLGQVNRSTASEEPMSIPVGNEMEDSFEAVALEVNGITRVASATTFPAVSFTPISIYRKC
jgi:hypothetical protein